MIVLDQAGMPSAGTALAVERDLELSAVLPRGAQDAGQTSVDRPGFPSCAGVAS